MLRPGHVQVAGRLRWLHGVPRAASAILATGLTRDTRLAFPLDRTAALVAGMVEKRPRPGSCKP